MIVNHYHPDQYTKSISTVNREDYHSKLRPALLTIFSLTLLLNNSSRSSTPWSMLLFRGWTATIFSLTRILGDLVTLRVVLLLQPLSVHALSLSGSGVSVIVVAARWSGRRKRENKTVFFVLFVNRFRLYREITHTHTRSCRVYIEF